MWLGGSGWAEDSVFDGWQIAAAYPKDFMGFIAATSICNSEAPHYNLYVCAYERTVLSSAVRVHKHNNAHM